MLSKAGVSDSSYSGRQAFYNLYVNSRDFGVRIGPATGPATKALFAGVEALPEHPAEANVVAAWLESLRKAGFSDQFIERQFAGLTREQLLANMVDFPSADYFEFLCILEPHDRTFLRAALEIAAQNPLYVLRYTLRNSWLFVWSPGHAHGRTNMEYVGLQQTGLDFLPFHRLTTPTEGVPARGVRELAEEPLAQGLKILVPVADSIERTWKSYYVSINHILVIISIIGAMASFL